jgi:ribonuclease BN (tRNA processing enzyme)
LFDNTLLLDAGTAGTQLSLEAQTRIRHILLSHLHFDHIKGLPTLADNLSEQGGQPVTVAGTPEVIQGLRQHLFNSDVYPDFFKIPTADCPVLTSQQLKPRESYRAGQFLCTPIPVNHTVPTVGYLIEDSASAILYSGDTFMTEQLWDVAKGHPLLRAVFLECSYPDAFEHLAVISKHLTPRLFAKEIAKLSRPDVRVYAYHLKPIYRDQISKELMELNMSNLAILEEGQIVEI